MYDHDVIMKLGVFNETFMRHIKFERKHYKMTNVNLTITFMICVHSCNKGA